MDGYLSSVHRAQRDATNSSRISLLLTQSQPFLKLSSFKGLSDSDVESSFRAIWKFLLLAAANSSSSIRLSAYQAAGAFLLRLTPHFPALMRKTFSDISDQTICSKSSDVIAAAFAFLSNTVDLSLLGRFLESTPVIPHFPSSDPEQISSIIGSLGDLGVDWFRDLLRAFLPAGNHAAIAAIVRRYPQELIADLLAEPDLPLLSSILSTPHFPVEDLDLLPIARRAMAVLADPDATPALADVALRLLAVRSASFSFVVEPLSDSAVRLIVSGDSADINIADLNTFPALYLIGLPLRYCLPDFERDEPTLLAAKFAGISLGATPARNSSRQVLDALERGLQSSHAGVVSAALRALARCLPALSSVGNGRRLAHLVDGAFSHPVVSVDVLKVVGAAGPKYFPIALDLCLSDHARVRRRAKKTLLGLVSGHNVDDVAASIARRLDPLDPTAVARLLDVLTSLLVKWPRNGRRVLWGVVGCVLELTKLFKDDLNVLMFCFGFLGQFDLSFANADQVGSCLKKATGLIVASFQALSGDDWREPIKATLLQRSASMIELFLKSLSFDVVNDRSFGYRHYMRPLLTATALVSSVPVGMVEKGFALSFTTELLKVFPLEATQFLHRFWGKFGDLQRTELLRAAVASVWNTQDIEPAAVLMHLMMQWPTDLSAQLANLAEFGATRNLFCRCFLHFLRRRRQEGDLELEAAVADKHPHLFETLFGKAPPEQKETVTVIKAQQDISVEVVPWQILRSQCARKELLHLVRSQLIGATYDFKVGELQAIFAWYCDRGDAQGVLAALRYAQSRRILLYVNMAIVPEVCVSHVLRYLTAIDPVRAKDVSRRFLNRSGDVQHAAICADPSGYLQSVANSQKLNKNQLRTLAAAVSCVQFDGVLLQHTVLGLLQNKVSLHKVRYLLVVVANSLNALKPISRAFLSGLLLFLGAHKSEPQICRCLHLIDNIARKLPLVTELLATLHPTSPAAALLCPADRKVVREFLRRHDPSRFICGLRLFSRALQSERDTKAVVRQVVSKLPRFGSLPGVLETASPSWPVQLLAAVLPVPAAASFAAVAQCLVGDKHWKTVASLLTDPTNVGQLTVWLRVAAVKAKGLSGAEREALLGDLVERTMTDCLGATDAFVEVLSLAAVFLLPSAMMQLIRSFLVSSRYRFFPVYVALGMLRKVLAAIEAPPVSVEEFVRGVVGFADDVCKCRGEALRAFGDRATMRKGLQLAVFEGDCDESEFVLGADDSVAGFEKMASLESWGALMQAGDTLEPGSSPEVDSRFEPITPMVLSSGMDSRFEPITPMILSPGVDSRFEPITPMSMRNNCLVSAPGDEFEPIRPSEFVESDDEA
jgi:hypothetical protein